MRYTSGMVLFCLWLMACSGTSSDETYEQSSKPDSLCDSGCNSVALSIPVMTATGGYGAVTTYGSTSDPETSTGGACNYGSTEILYYAAAHVHLEPGDNQGLWNGGHACGDCYRVRVGSDTGWRTTIVRITDKCPDAYCGIDLGGAPARDLMGSEVGRYTGEWEWISCDSASNVSDNTPSLHVKEGSNAWWSLVQVRNPPAAVESIQWENPTSSDTGSFSWATEAENFWKTPDTLLTMTDTVLLMIEYRTGQKDTLKLQGSALAQENTDWDL